MRQSTPIPIRRGRPVADAPAKAADDLYAKIKACLPLHTPIRNDEALKLNDGGISYLAENLEQVCRPCPRRDWGRTRVRNCLGSKRSAKAGRGPDQTRRLIRS